LHTHAPPFPPKTPSCHNHNPTAHQCIKLRKDWDKGHWRRGAAQEAMGHAEVRGGGWVEGGVGGGRLFHRSFHSPLALPQPQMLLLLFQQGSTSSCPSTRDAAVTPNPCPQNDIPNT